MKHRLSLFTLLVLGACDSDLPSAPAPLAITVTELAAGTVGVVYQAEIGAKNGDPTSYAWSIAGGTLPPGLSISEAGNPSTRISGTPTRDGAFSFRVRVEDSRGNRNDAMFSIQIAPSQAAPLVITTTDLPGGVAGDAYTAALSASGGTNEGYLWRVSRGDLPGGLTLTGVELSASIDGTLLEAGEFDFTVEVTDSKNNRAEHTYTIEIEAPPGVAIVTADLPDGRVGDSYSAQLAAAGGAGAPFVWTLVQGELPAGLTLTTTGAVFGVPTDDGLGSFVIGVEDAGGGTDVQSFIVRIVPELPPLAITTAQLPRASVGAAYSTDVTATGGTASDYEWSVSAGALPPGLALASGTPAARISGTPAGEGTFSFTLRVRDSEGRTNERAFTLQISPLFVPIHIVTTSVPSGAVNLPYQATITAADGTGTGYNWVVAPGSLPPGLTIAVPGTPSTTITGTPQMSGSFGVTVTVIDSNNDMASRVFTLDVEPSMVPLVFAQASLANAGLGAPYDQAITVSGGSGAGYTWAVAQGSLPTGLALQAAGTPSTRITGTPSAIGSFAFDVRVTDSDGGTATRSYQIDVGAPLTIATRQLPIGRTGESYTATITAAGGSGAGYSWSIVQGTLPAGLTVLATGTPSTVISGTPTAFGNVRFSVEVRDSFNTATVVNLALLIRGPARYVAWVGDSAVNDDTSIFAVDLDAPPGSPQIQLNPNANGTGDGSTTARHTQFSPDNSKIAFRGDFLADSIDELFVVDLTGALPGIPRRVSGTQVLAGDVTEFLWSPDGRKIAYQADQDTDAVPELYVVDVSGTTPGPALKVSGPMVASGFVQFQDFSWSPDSRWLVYQADQLTNDVFELFIADVSGPTPLAAVRVNLALTNFSAQDCEDELLWTPDSRRFLYLCEQETADVMELFMVDVTGAAPGVPIKLSGPMVASGDVNIANGEVKISPDGRYVTYLADQVTDTVDELWLVDISGTSPSVPSRLNGTMVTGGDVLTALWSPDSRRILYQADQDIDLVNELYLIGVGGTGPLMPFKVNAPFAATQSIPSTDGSFDWSDDGRWIGFRADAAIDSSFEIFVAPVTGSGAGAAVRVHGVLPSGRTIDAFAFSRDGTRIGFRGETTVDARSDLQIVDLSGGTPGSPVTVAQPTVALGNVVDFAWLPSGAVYVRGDLTADGAFNAYLSDAATTAPSLLQLNPPLPLSGTVSTLLGPF